MTERAFTLIVSVSLLAATAVAAFAIATRPAAGADIGSPWDLLRVGPAPAAKPARPTVRYLVKRKRHLHSRMVRKDIPQQRRFLDPALPGTRPHVQPPWRARVSVGFDALAQERAVRIVYPIERCSEPTEPLPPLMPMPVDPRDVPLRDTATGKWLIVSLFAGGVVAAAFVTEARQFFNRGGKHAA